MSYEDELTNRKLDSLAKQTHDNFQSIMDCRMCKNREECDRPSYEYFRNAVHKVYNGSELPPLPITCPYSPGEKVSEFISSRISEIKTSHNKKTLSPYGNRKTKPSKIALMFENIPQVDTSKAFKLRSGGYHKFESIIGEDPETVSLRSGISTEECARIIDEAEKIYRAVTKQ